MSLFFPCLTADNKSCKSGESSLKRNSDHLDAGTSDQPAGSTTAEDRAVGDSETTASSKTPDLSHNIDPDVATSATLIPDPVEQIDFTVVFMKEKFEISLPSSHTVADLKQLMGQLICPHINQWLNDFSIQSKKQQCLPRHKSCCSKDCPANK